MIGELPIALGLEEALDEEVRSRYEQRTADKEDCGPDQEGDGDPPPPGRGPGGRTEDRRARYPALNRCQAAFQSSTVVYPFGTFAFTGTPESGADFVRTLAISPYG